MVGGNCDSGTTCVGSCCVLSHVTLPKEIAQWIPHKGLLSDDEWRSLGVKQSLGWEHYMVHGNDC